MKASRRACLASPATAPRCWLLALPLCASIGVCHAELEFQPLPGVDVKAGLRAGFAAVSMINANLGLGQVDFLTRERHGDPSWSEIDIQPYVGFTSRDGWYGDVSVVGAQTFFDGDAAAFTRAGDGGVGIETALFGWRSDVATHDSDKLVVDLSLGRQTLDIGDGFLIDDGNFDVRHDGGVWLVPRQAFQRSLVARLDYRAWHSDLFFLEADPDNDEPALAGGNFEYQFTGGGHAGLLYLHILDTDTPRLFGVREGMNVLSARVNDLRLAALPQVGWWGEATRQFGDGRFGRIDASAWYAEAVYHFEHLPWRPRLSYRYAWFSGDANPHDHTRRDFDPLFYGFDKRTWGTWFQGEVTGGWLLFNNNQRNHLVHLAATPRADLTVGMIGGHFSLVEKNYRGVAVSSRDFGDELNIYTDWAINKYVFLSAGYGVMFPGEGAIQGVGDDETFHLFEMGLYFTY
jgi:hypothetical protein